MIFLTGASPRGAFHPDRDRLPEPDVLRRGADEHLDPVLLDHEASLGFIPVRQVLGPERHRDRLPLPRRERQALEAPQLQAGSGDPRIHVANVHLDDLFARTPSGVLHLDAHPEGLSGADRLGARPQP
jgi:hypothetical protein